MPTSTYTPLANLTLSSSAASVTFSSISQAYRDLVLVVSSIGTNADNLRIQVNSDTGSNYSYVLMGGTGSVAESASTTTTYIQTAADSTTSPQTQTFQFMDYSATDKHKTILNRGGNAGSYVSAVAGRWANTSAITTILVTRAGNSYAAGSTFALYGIAA